MKHPVPKYLTQVEPGRYSVYDSTGKFVCGLDKNGSPELQSVDYYELVACASTRAMSRMVQASQQPETAE